MDLSVEQLLQWMNAYLWPMTRIGGIFMLLPVLGSHFIPKKVRLLMTVMITIVIAPTLPPMPTVDALSWQGMILVGQQIIIGLAIAFVFQIVMQTFIIAGQIIAMQSGLGFAALVDPGSGSSVPLVSQFYLLLTTLLFLLLDGHLMVIKMISNSFHSIPVNIYGLSSEHLWRIIEFSGEMFKGGVLVALPAIISLLLVNLAFGVMTRAAPQLNIFSIGFPITLMLGLIILYLTLTGIFPHAELMFNKGFNFIQSGLLRS